jgi:type 1 fimbria pilin
MYNAPASYRVTVQGRVVNGGCTTTPGTYDFHLVR